MGVKHGPESAEALQQKINAAIEVLRNLQRHDLAYCDPRDDERDMLPVMDGQWFEADEVFKALEILKGKGNETN